MPSLIQIYKDGQLTTRITAAQRKNDFEVEQQKGVRLGFMGHITYISDEVCKLADKCWTELAELDIYFNDEAWCEYKQGVFRETRERDRAALGGSRPNAPALAPDEPANSDDDDDGCDDSEGDVGGDQVCSS